jgi:phage terminase small subunit
MPQLKNYRQEDFCYHISTNKGPTEAYRAAGYKTTSDKVASINACRLLAKANIQARVDELKAKQHQRLIFDQARILDELGRNALSDLRKLFNADGSLKNPTEWPDECAAAVAGIEVEKLFSEPGDEPRRQVGTVTKIKLWDKNKALEILAKHFKILYNGPAVGVNVGEGATLNLQVNMAGDTAKQRLLKLVGPGAYSNGHTNGSAEPGGAPGAQAVA